MKYRKRPAEVDAYQVTWKNWDEIKTLLGDKMSYHSTIDQSEVADTCGESEPFISFEVYIPGDGFFEMRHGEWLVKESNRFYWVDPNVFNEIFEDV